MSHAPVQCVCFDAGGVIVRICRSWEEGCRAAGLPVRDESRRLSSVPVRKGLVERYQKGEICCDDFARGVSEALAGAYTPAEIMAIHGAWILGEYEGIGEVIDRIHAAGVETAMLSNTNHSHWEQMNAPGAFAGFQKIRRRHASHLLGLHKPDVEIYRALQERIGVPAAGILFFDDLPENVEAARQAGWMAAQVDPMGDTAAQITRALRDRGVAV